MSRATAKAAGRVRAPSARPRQSYSHLHQRVNLDRPGFSADSEVVQPIAGRLGPGTVISCAVDAELWPEWTDLPFDVVLGRI